MKYKIIKLDRRYNYRNHFKYVLEFSPYMKSYQGPLNFARAKKYFTEAHGWSVDIDSWLEIFNFSSIVYMLSSEPHDINDIISSQWAWSVNYQKTLRIYVKSEKELTLFSLKYPLD